MVVTGDDVRMFGLAAEHTLEDLVQWNGMPAACSVRRMASRSVRCLIESSLARSLARNDPKSDEKWTMHNCMQQDSIQLTLGG